MLRYYVKQSSSEDFRKVALPPKDNVWIHGDLVELDDLKLLSNMYEFDLNILRDILDKNELPRVETRDDGLYVFVRIVRRGKNGLVTTTPVLLAVKGTVFINVSTAPDNDRELMTPDKLRVVHDANGHLLSTFATVVNEYEALMHRTSQRIIDTGKRLRTHEVTNDDFVKFVTVEDNLNEYRTNLSSMLVVTERLKELSHVSRDIESIEDIRLYIRQLLVATESYNQSIVSIRNAYGTIANNTLNRRIKTLTVLTLLVTLPNVFYGMYGMNVTLPFQHEAWAYPAMIVFTILVIIIVYLLAKRLKIF